MAKKSLIKVLTLPMILEQFSEEGKKLLWHILFLDVAGDLGEWNSIPQLENYIIGVQQVHQLSWNELCQLAEKFDYVIDLKLAACKSMAAIALLDKKIGSEKLNLKSVCDIIIDITDGELIEIFAKDKSISDRITKNFGPLPIGVYRPLNKK